MLAPERVSILAVTSSQDSPAWPSQIHFANFSQTEAIGLIILHQRHRRHQIRLSDEEFLQSQTPPRCIIPISFEDRPPLQWYFLSTTWQLSQIWRIHSYTMSLTRSGFGHSQAGSETTCAMPDQSMPYDLIILQIWAWEWRKITPSTFYCKCSLFSV